MMGNSSSSPPSGVDILTCSRPMMERRLRPQHDQSLKCPRCDSTHTKFCYYNNYSLSQPRYFCKTCRRYWTKGGTLRNIPVGGGCRKNKKVSSSSSSAPSSTATSPTSSSFGNKKSSLPNLLPGPQSLGLLTPPDDHLSSSFPEMMQFSNPHHHHQFGDNFHLAPHFMGIDSPPPIDFMEGKYGNGGFLGATSSTNPPSPRNMQLDFLGTNRNGDFGIMAQTFPPFGMMSNNVGPTMLPYDHHHQFMNDMHHHDHDDHVDMKPNPKMLSLEWHDHQGCSDNVGKDSFGYINGVGGSWNGLINGYGTSATNPLV
ncbi:unnamed protein product [Cuscuta campestris]|uniref:Dof zinc finger protein n=1 Tax=Cuscuta campestris TaxID=132261 RepID=A0A484N569_9ASTE|nr:unnamed protein product [Cuscuta campestris]